MPMYKAPLRDVQFIIKELLGMDQLRCFEQHAEISDDLIDAVLTEGAKFAENILLPLNQSGDEQGCTWKDGVVTTPTGFPEAFRAFVDAGWPALSFDVEDGGQGLPEVISLFIEEMICSVNLSFGLYPGLTRGACFLLKSHGSEELKNIYLEKLVTANWCGTMCLTEAHCGTDLGLLRTKAVPQEDGTYKITGTKIFISSGEHDLTDNIIHFVIARTPDGAPGIRGISLFLVPKFMVNPDGTIGARNGVSCGSIEHKMGIKASSTCVMNFDEATGYLVGDKFKGVANMFTMMNVERLGVGNQGLGIGEISYQNALNYAQERLQGRSVTGTKYPNKPADPIICHPDVRRMLLTMKTLNEGNRMLAAWVAMHLDIAHCSQNAEEKQMADDLVQLMTPVIKSYLTDTGSEVANLGVQIYGGHGYVRDHGMEQFVRDARIAQIYEGTNGVQALDLIGRKMPAFAGRYLRRFFHPILAYLTEKNTDETLREFVDPVMKAFGRLQQVTVAVAQRSQANPDEAAAVASDYLRLFGLVTSGYLWIRTVEIAQQKLGQNDDVFYQGKIDTARFFMQKILTQNSALYASIMSGSKPIMGIQEASFGPF